jgi:hypothetical protein
MPQPKTQSKPPAPLPPRHEGHGSQAGLQPVPPRLWLRAASAALMGGLMGLLIDALLPAGGDRNKH